MRRSIWGWLMGNKNSVESNSNANGKQTTKNDQHYNSDSEASDIETTMIKAKQTISEIESIIREQLEMLSEGTKGGEHSPPKKRVAPKLIRPINKKKNRMGNQRLSCHSLTVRGEMTYNPERGTWEGNEAQLRDFQPNGPALIRPKGAHALPPNGGAGQSQESHGMQWDPQELIWRGNERAVAKFPSTTGPALISQLNPSSEPITKNDMVFDPEKMTWVGNDTVLDIFSDIETAEEKNAFEVGSEFSLSPELKAAFRRRAHHHKASLEGWLPRPLERPDAHLSAIRSMSIIRIVNQAKYGVVSSSPPTSFSSPSHSSHLTLSAPVPHDMEDWNDVDVQPSQKLRLKNLVVNSSDGEDWDFAEDSKESSKEDPKPAVRMSRAMSKDLPLSQYRDDDNESFDDLEISENSPLMRKLSASERPKELFTTSSSDKLSISSGDESEDISEWQGLEVPKRLVLIRGNNFDQESGNWKFSDSDREEDNNSPLALTPPPKQIIEEDWSDVEFTEGALELRKVDTRQEVQQKVRKIEEDDWSEVDIPVSGLHLNPLRKIRSDNSSDPSDDEWSDIEIPLGQSLQLRGQL